MNTEISRFNEKYILSHNEKKEAIGYILHIRKEFETNPEILDMLESSNDQKFMEDQIIGIFREKEGPSFLLDSKSEELFRLSLDKILKELSELKKRPASLYLVDAETGETISPIKEENLFQPNSYINLDNKEVTPSPILHPGIAASLILNNADTQKLEEATKNASKFDLLAYEHLTDENKITLKAIEKLRKIGHTVISTDHKTESEVSFGRENVCDIFQSPNLRFNRTEAYSATLCNKIARVAKMSDVIELGEIEKIKGNKFTEFRIGYNLVQKG